MHQVKLKAEKREKTGKQAAKKIRQAGMVPGVVYGKNFDSQAIKVDVRDLEQALGTSGGTRVIINLEVSDNGNSETYITMVSEIQKDIYQKNYYHVDFHKITLDEKVECEVPVSLVGEAKGVISGGMLDQIIWNIPVKSLPLDIPEKIEVDISHLDENDQLLVKELPELKNVEILVDPDETVAVVHPPRMLELKVKEEEEALEDKLPEAMEGEVEAKVLPESAEPVS